MPAFAATAMAMNDSILYLSDADVAGLGLDVDALRDAVAAAFAAKARHRAAASGKSTVVIAAGHIFQAKPGCLLDGDVAGMKWFGLVPAGSTAGPSIDSVILVSDIRSGKLSAIVAGNWITAKRTAAMSAIAARSLARAASATVGFVGAGVQADSHLEALVRVLPDLTRVVVCSRTAASASRLADAARRMGLDAAVTAEPRDAVEGMDVIVTTVPEGSWRNAPLEPGWVAPGAFVAAVDLARSWDRARLREFEILATDDHEQTRALTAEGRMTYAGPYEADLADLCSGRVAGRTNDGQRALFNFSGHALADLASAQLVMDTARARRVGTALPRC